MKIDANKAFELMYELLKKKPWLNSAGIMSDADRPFEEAALMFLIKLETATSWGDCPEPARRVANSLLIDFMAKLSGPYAQHVWKVPSGLSPWRQAAKLIRDEIHEIHRRLPRTH